MINLKMVKEAKERIKGSIKNTLLYRADKLSNLSEGEVFLKLENFQNSGSFKMRGASNKIISLTDDEKKCGVIASSAGNHAQGVAFSATQLGIKSTIIMPKKAPIAKVVATKQYGAKVVLHGDVYDDAYAKACEIQKEEGSIFIHPFDDDLVIAGQATMALEILEEINDIEQIIVPIGGGGLISGIAFTAKQINPNIKIIGVQTKNAPSMKIALENNNNNRIDITKTIADGIAVAKPGDKTFQYVKKYVDEIVLVSEDQISEAILYLMEKCNIISEGAGAVTVAAMLNNKIDLKNKKTVGIISGGNVDVTLVEKIINRSLITTNRRIEIKIIIDETSRDLQSIIEIIYKFNGNIYNIKQGRYRNSLNINQQSLTIVIDTEDKKHQDQILNELKKNNIKIMGE